MSHSFLILSLSPTVSQFILLQQSYSHSISIYLDISTTPSTSNNHPPPNTNMCIIYITEATECGHNVEEETEFCDEAAENDNLECDDPERRIVGRVPGKCSFCRDADVDRHNMAADPQVIAASRSEAAQTEEHQLRAVLEASKRDAPERWEADIERVLATSRADFNRQAMEREAAEMEQMMQLSMKEYADRVARAPKEYYRFCIKFSCGHLIDTGYSKVERQPGAAGPAFLTQDDPYECPDCQGLGGSSAGPAANWEALSKPRPNVREEGSRASRSQAVTYVDESVDLAPGKKGKGRRDAASLASERPASHAGAGTLANQMGKMAIKEAAAPVQKPKEKPKEQELKLPPAEQMRQKRLAALGGLQSASGQKAKPTPQAASQVASQAGGSSAHRPSGSRRQDASTVRGAPNSQVGTAGTGRNAPQGGSTASANRQSAPPQRQDSGSVRGAPRSQVGTAGQGKPTSQKANTTSSNRPPNNHSQRQDSASTRGGPSPKSPLSPTPVKPSTQSSSTISTSHPSSSPQRHDSASVYGGPRSQVGTTGPRKTATDSQSTISTHRSSGSQRQDAASAYGGPRGQAGTADQRKPASQSDSTVSTQNRSAPQQQDTASMRGGPRTQVGSNSPKNPASLSNQQAPAMKKIEEEKESESEPEREDPDYVRAQRLARFNRRDNA